MRHFLKRKGRCIFVASLVVLISCFLLMSIFSGFKHEAPKVKAMLVVLALVLLLLFLIFDPLVFLMAAMTACCLRSGAEDFVSDNYTESSSKPRTVIEEQQPSIRKQYLAFLKSRLASFEAQLLLNPKHFDETTNRHYRHIVRELWLFTLLYILLLSIVTYSHNPLCYENTNALEQLLSERRLGSTGFAKISRLNDLYDFMHSILIYAFNEARDYNDEIIQEPGWIQFGIAKLLGVVRLRQVRLKDPSKQTANFEQSNFLPAWQQYKKLHFVSEYWRISMPWLWFRDSSWFSWLLLGQYNGKLFDYPTDNGFDVLLARNVQNSLKMLEFLKNNNWLDAQTAAVFIDFTLYSVDANIFSICTLMMERTPFGLIITTVRVHSAALLWNFTALNYMELLGLLLYVLLLIKFIKGLIIGLWFKRSKLNDFWTWLDIGILLLNLLLLLLMALRTYIVMHLLHRLQEAQKNEFVDFRIPARIDKLTAVAAGLLIFITTLHIWKLLQFARDFRLFTNTLFHAAKPTLLATMAICIFIIGFAFASYIINGSNTEAFERIMRSISSVLMLTLGFNIEVSEKNLSYGGDAMGFILYTLLLIVMSIILMSLLITIIMDTFKMAKASYVAESKLSFWQFLKTEYWQVAWLCRYCRCRKYKHQQNRTVSENIELSMERQAMAALKSPNQSQESEDLNKARKYAETQLQRLNKTSKIIKTQMEIIALELEYLEAHLESDEESSEE